MIVKKYSDIDQWGAAGFIDTLSRLSMKHEIASGNEKAIESGVQGCRYKVGKRMQS